MNKKLIIILALLLLGGAVVLTYALSRPIHNIFPRDAASAKTALQQALRREGVQVHGAQVAEEQIESISTSDSWIEDLWVFGILPPKLCIWGGARYFRVYLVGPSVVPSPGLGVNTCCVTSDFFSAFKWRVAHKPPTSEAEALDIAKSYVSLETHTRPSKLKILNNAELPAKLAEWLLSHRPDQAEVIRAQIIAPQLNISKVVGPRNSTAYTVEFCTFSEDYWSDIIFWHIVIGKEMFSVAKRYIYIGSRVVA